ncbi:Polyadenylate-binding protein 2 [Spatholobus suberectus]|nr:Polyadenylate-binding protein 2 [Spatholobus suberectus]
MNWTKSVSLDYLLEELKLATKEEIDSRSIYVGNVDYACTSEQLRQHFQTCGTVNRVTIPTNKHGQPKGFAYIDAVCSALTLNESVLHGRKLKVCPKHTNIPGMKQYRGRRPFNLRFRTPLFYPPSGYGNKNTFLDLHTKANALALFNSRCVAWTIDIDQLVTVLIKLIKEVI